MKLVKMAKWCIMLLLTRNVFSDFYLSHGGELAEITEFVFHCVNLHGTSDVAMCFFVCGVMMVVVRKA